jgi:cytochrome P450
MHRALAHASRVLAPRDSSALPRGPRSYLASTLQLLRDPYRFYFACARRYGDLFTLPAPPSGDRQPLVIVGHPDGARALFAAEPDQLQVPRPDIWAPIVGPSSLLALDGPRHRADRKLLMPSFHGPRISAYGQTMAALTERAIATWPDGTPFDLRPVTRALSLEVIIRTVFGVHDDAEVERARRAVVAYLAPGNLLPVTFPRLRHRLFPPYRRFMATRQALDELLFARIAAARRAGQRGGGDVLSLFLEARYEDGSAMDDGAIRDELITLLIAGHETSAQALAWAVDQLLRHPPVLARLQAEVDAPPTDAGPDVLAGLPYLEAVCRETLRRYPIVTDVGRRLRQPLTILGRTLPAGVAVFPSVLLIHHREDLYPEPARFRPERFLERRFGSAEFLPFGGGHRRCIGAAFAMFEMKVMLAVMLRRARLRLADTRPNRPAHTGIIVGPGRPVRVVAQRRA